jgi:hypothetical protein
LFATAQSVEFQLVDLGCLSRLTCTNFLLAAFIWVW